MNANSGYIGWSMSVRAAAAYDDGEMPKSKWTKSLMLAAIARCIDDNDIDICEDAANYLWKMTKPELFDRFFYQSSWHHTGKYFNVTDFYSVDEHEVRRYASHPTKRVYRIRYMLGDSKRLSIATYKTRAIAVNYLKRRGFKETTLASYGKGGFYAIVTWESKEI